MIGGGAPPLDEGVRIVAAGDAALLVEFADRIDPSINQRAIALAETLDAAAIPGVRDVASTYRSVVIHFDPLRANYDEIVTRVEREASKASDSVAAAAEPIDVPVCYGGELGPDLDDVAAFAGLSAAEVVALHTSRAYRVFMLGFVPGFTYMGTVDDRIAAPRLPAPRIRVPAGSIGIAGIQTGIYPAATPGGWRILGRTPLKPFDLARAEPFMFKPGATVRFHAIDAAEFVKLEHAY